MDKEEMDDEELGEPIASHTTPDLTIPLDRFLVHEEIEESEAVWPRSLSPAAADIA